MAGDNQQFMQPGNFPGSNVLSDPMANMALQYGQSIAGQGKDFVEKKMDKYISSSKLRYYFNVDTSYVGKKIGLLLMPFTHNEWSLHYQQDSPVPPRFDINAPDLYIPVMAVVTYILMSGIALGMNARFTPESLGVEASSALVWYIIEVLIIMFSLYLVNARTDLSTFDVIAFSGYKYVAMILCLVAGGLFGSTGYWVVLVYTGITISYFLLKTLRLKILPHSSTDGYGQSAGSHRMYLTFIVSFVQPFLMLYLTHHLSP